MPFDPDARLAEWRKSLLDTTKRNRLIKFAAGRAGGVYLLRPGLAELWAKLVRDGAVLTFPWKRELLGLNPELLDADALAADFDPNGGTAAPSTSEVAREFTELAIRSPKLAPDHLLTELPDRQLAARLTRLFRNAKEAETDHGVTTLYAAFGFLRWFESADSGEEILSPLLLVPVRLDRETVESPFTLTAEDDDVLTNHCLAELLQTQFRIKLPTAAESPLDPEHPGCLADYLKAVAERVKHVPRWGIDESAALGVFNFQKLAMWEDLGRNADRVKAHPLCRAVAGDSAVSLAAPQGLPEANELDRVVPPAAVAHILDADSSQHEAIEAAKRGAHLVIDGPPGTGKSQTIANIIAEALAAGKTVLFVSEKTAALDVVKRRLDKCGLGDFCLELHSHKANKKSVLAELGRCLELAAAGVPDTAERLRELAEVRGRLNEFVAELHAMREPLGWSAFRVHGELVTLDRTPGRSRVDIPDVFAKDAEYVRKGSAILEGLADCHSVLDEPGGHPWRGCKLTTYSHAAADEAKFNLAGLANATPAAETVANGLAGCGVGGVPFAVRSWRSAEADARTLLELPLFPAEWFSSDPRKAAEHAVELHQATTEVNDLKGRLPEFDPGAIAQLAGVVELQAGLTPDRERLRVAVGTARERAASLGQGVAALRGLGEAIGELATASAALTRHLHLPAVPPSEHLRSIADAAAKVAASGPIPPSWWDATRHAELLAVATRAYQDHTAAQNARIELVKRYSPAALSPESSPLARQAAHAGRSFFSRLLPLWWGLKKQVAAWYPGAVPSGAQFRADLALLAEYHQKSDAVRAVVAAYPDELLKDAAGKVDWESVNGLTAVGVLAESGVSAAFRASTAPKGKLDRAALADAAANVARTEAAFRERWSAAERVLVLPPVAGRRPAELGAWCDAELAAAGRELDALTRLTSLLGSGKDIVVSLVRDRVETLAKFVASRERLRSLIGAGPAPDEVTLGPRAELATKLLAFLDCTGLPVTPPLAATLAEPARRDHLRDVVKRSEAARGEFDKIWVRVSTDLFDPDITISTNVVLYDTPLPDLARWAAARAADADRLAEWARFLQVEKDAAAFGLTPVLDEVKAGEFPATSAAAAFRARFYRLWLDALHQRIPALAGFGTETHERHVARFAELDRLSIRTTPDRLRGELLARPTRPRHRDGAPDASELGILLREVNKKRRHLPLRHLFRQIPDILPRLKPCLMMSPLAVSTYLDTPELAFDLVIFDEASQVRPHDAVCAIYRGRQLVVGGDPRQLPPTDFFTRTGEDIDENGEGEGPAAGFESLLDVALSLGLTRKRLRWHYRSRREGLIAFSNRYFYDGRLITFPSADEATGRAVTFVEVPDGRFHDGVNVVEARRVAEIVMGHARTTPDRSLGVIAFSQKQQDRILDELEALRRASPDAEAFFSDDREDPFFVKNLENVQGDERDAILLSVGYGPDDAGKVAMRFGPLNRAGGERRLNVAVTRARHAMTVVASMTAGDIDLSRTQAEGVKVLKAFLDYADRGPVALAEAVTEADARGADSPFEREVGEELRRRGLTVHRQVGCGGYLIDLAVVDPQQGGRYVLGVECDGATYHSAATARDRDRLRQAVLEGLGWKLVRVWSSDWVRDREKQVRRVLAALDAKAPSPGHDPENVPVIKVRTPAAKKQEFDSIEAVPEGAVADALAGVLTDFGSMPAEDLIAAVSKRLGFKRTGPKIRERVAEALNSQVTSGSLTVGDDDRVRVAGRS